MNPNYMAIWGDDAAHEIVVTTEIRAKPFAYTDNTPHPLRETDVGFSDCCTRAPSHVAFSTSHREAVPSLILSPFPSSHDERKVVSYSTRSVWEVLKTFSLLLKPFASGPGVLLGLHAEAKDYVTNIYPYAVVHFHAVHLLV